MTEAAAKEAGHDVKAAKFKLGGVGAGPVYDDRDGLVKLVVDSKYGEILGAHIVGNRACDMIAELVAIKDLEGGYQELQRIIHPHPTISEAIPEAARAIDGWADPRLADPSCEPADQPGGAEHKIGSGLARRATSSWTCSASRWRWTSVGSRPLRHRPIPQYK